MKINKNPFTNFIITKFLIIKHSTDDMLQQYQCFVFLSASSNVIQYNEIRHRTIISTFVETTKEVSRRFQKHFLKIHAIRSMQYNFQYKRNTLKWFQRLGKTYEEWNIKQCIKEEWMIGGVLKKRWLDGVDALFRERYRKNLKHR